MKKTIIATLILATAFVQAQGQAVQIQPLKPQRGDTITISYDPTSADAKIEVNAPSVTVVFTYSTFYDQPWKMPMKKTGKTWSASFLAGRFATFATFYLQSGEQVQKPAEDKHYSVAVYAGNKRIKSGLLHESYSLSAQMPKSPNLQANKLALLQQELLNNPDNYEAKVAMLNTKMTMAKDPAEKLSFREQARKVIAQQFAENPTLPGNVNLVTMGYLMIGEKSRLDSVRKVIMDRYPDADISKDLRASLIAKEKDSSARIPKLEALLKKGDTPGEEGSGTIHALLFDYYANNKDSVKALFHASKLITKETPYSPERLKEIAAKLTENKIAPAAAMAYANQSLGMVEKWPVGIIRYFPEFGYIPSYVPDSTRAQAVSDSRSELLTLKALNAHYLHHDSEANRFLTAALVTPAKETIGRQALLNGADLLMQTAEPKKAFELLWQALNKNPTDSVVLKMAKSAFLKFNPSEVEFNIKVKELEAIEMAQLKTKMLSLMLQKPGPELSGLVDLDGKPVTAEKMKDKIVILDFWATWCVPCMHEMPYFQKVYEQYKNNPDVLFMVVNSGSNNTITDARKWTADNPQYTFPVYFNTDKNIGEKVGFTLIPTIAVIDRAGKMQFRTIGFEGEILQKKLAVEIEILLNR